jgi:hypothetical protein
MPARRDQTRFRNNLPVYAGAFVDVVVVPQGVTIGKVLDIENLDGDVYERAQFLTCPRSECGKSFILTEKEPRTGTVMCPHCSKASRAV